MSFLKAFAIIAASTAIVVAENNQRQTARRTCDHLVVMLEERISALKAAVRRAGKIDSPAYRMWVGDNLTRAQSALVDYDLSPSETGIRIAARLIEKAERDALMFLKVSV